MAGSNLKDNRTNESNQTIEPKQDGCFGFLAKKEGETKHDAVMEDLPKENKEGLTRLHSQSNPLSDEEFEGERKKNKKTILVDDKNGDVVAEGEDEEKAIKEKEMEEGIPTPEADHEKDHAPGSLPDNEKKEKKGIIEKIKEKLHKNGESEFDQEKKEN